MVADGGRSGKLGQSAGASPRCADHEPDQIRDFPLSFPEGFSEAVTICDSVFPAKDQMCWQCSYLGILMMNTSSWYLSQGHTGQDRGD